MGGRLVDRGGVVVKLSAYAEYKPSGVEWLGDVPAHWNVKRLKDAGTLLAGSGFPNEFQGAKGEALPFYKVGNLVTSSDGRLMGVSPNTVSFETAEELGARVIPPGAVVYAKIGAALLLNRRRIVSIQCCIDNNMTAYAPRMSIDFSAWAFYWTSILDFAEFANPGTIPSLSEGDQAVLPLLLPPKAEQRAITDFLDRVTLSLDMLVAKKRTLIERLKEKRTALISCTVTRGLPTDAARAAGLDPHPNLKPSGIDWLGDVPVHWDVAQLRRRCTILDCMHRTVPFVEEGIPLASIREVHGFEVDLSDAKQTTEEEYLGLLEGGRRPRIGDILFSRNATVGDAAIVATSEPFAMGQDVCLIRCDAQHPKYVLYLLRSEPVAQQVDSFIVGATFRRINVGHIRTFWGCWPPVDEQLVATNYLDRETALLNAMVDKSETVIERLQEYRTALITAAVTGKIDVRGTDIGVIGGQS